MFATRHVAALTQAGYFKAPLTAKIRPAYIPENVECVELLVGGKVSYDNGDGEREYGRGFMFWHLPGEHTIYMSKPYEPYECLVFRFSTDAEVPRQVDRMTDLRGCDFETWGYATLKAFVDGSADQALLCQHVYTKLLWEAHLSSRRRPTHDYPPSLRKALAALKRGPEGWPDVAAIAKTAGVSAPHLHALFKRHLDSSPGQTLLEQRLALGRQLLVCGDMLIKQIGEECGFENPESFCRAFRKKYNGTPGEFRELNAPRRELEWR